MLDNRYLGQITSDSSIQRQAERDELKQQLDEPDKGGLTMDEEQQCKEAFARPQALPKSYTAVWQDKNKRLEAHVLMHTARARAFRARDPARLKANSEREESETPDHPVKAANSPEERPVHGTSMINPQAQTMKTAAVSEIHPKPAKEDEMTVGTRKGRRQVMAPSSGSDKPLHRQFPSRTGSKGSNTIIDLTYVGNESEDMDAGPCSNTVFKKRVGLQTKPKPTPTNNASPFALKPQHLETPPPKRHNADGVRGAETKRNKQDVSQKSPFNKRHRSFSAKVTGPPTTGGPSSRPSQGSRPSLAAARATHKPAARAGSQLFEPVLGAGTSVGRESEEREDREGSYRRFLDME